MPCTGLKTCLVNFVYDNIKLFTLCEKFDTFCQLFSKTSASKVEEEYDKDLLIFYNRQTYRVT